MQWKSIAMSHWVQLHDRCIFDSWERDYVRISLYLFIIIHLYKIGFLDSEFQGFKQETTRKETC